MFRGYNPLIEDITAIQDLSPTTLRRAPRARNNQPPLHRIRVQCFRMRSFLT